MEKADSKIANTFIVEDIFHSRAKIGDKRFYKRFWFNDDTQNWLIKPNLKKVIKIRTNLPKLREYSLANNMNDSLIQKNNRSGLMDMETFFCVMYLLISEPKLGKKVFGYVLLKDRYYIFHVLVNDKKIAFELAWFGDGWIFRAYLFDSDGGRDARSVFLFFATI